MLFIYILYRFYILIRKVMKPKLIHFKDELAKAIQQYADVHCSGNFTEAVRQLTSNGLLSR